MLVVDDNTASRNLLSELLSGWKVSSELAADATSAITRLHSQSGELLDAVLVDLELPGADSAETICREGAQEGIPVVLMTRLRQTADAQHWNRLGFAASITKPVKRSELGGCLAAILGGGVSLAPCPADNFAPGAGGPCAPGCLSDSLGGRQSDQPGGGDRHTA